jgi:hypothetical protein
MILVLAMMAGLAGSGTPTAPTHLPPGAAASSSVRSDIEASSNGASGIGMPQHFAPELRQLALPNNNQLPPPCPPAYKLPLYGLMTLPVQKMGICNAHDWRPDWYNLTGP